MFEMILKIWILSTTICVFAQTTQDSHPIQQTNTTTPLFKVPEELPSNATKCLENNFNKCLEVLKTQNVTTTTASLKSINATALPDLRKSNKTTTLATIDQNDAVVITPSSKSVTDTEVSDLRKSNKTANLEAEQAAIEALKDPNDAVGVNTDTELIEDNINKTEDVLRNGKNYKLEPGVPLIQGQLAAILAGVFVLISALAYVALLSWRRYLEHRYGNREMLVNEEDFDNVNANDLRYFSI